MKTEKIIAAMGIVAVCWFVFVAAMSAGCSDESLPDPIVTVESIDATDGGADKKEAPDAKDGTPDAEPDTSPNPDSDAPNPDATTDSSDTHAEDGWTPPGACEKDEDCAPPGAWDWCTTTVRCGATVEFGAKKCVERPLPCQESFYVGCAEGHCLMCKDDDPDTWENCNDGVSCTTEFCDQGECQYGSTQGWCLIGFNCWEAGELTPDGCSLCDPSVSQDEFTPRSDGDACNDFDECTVNDACVAGKCESTTPADCDDGNPCTDDLCSASSGCMYEPTAAGTACTDGNACNGVELCLDGQCLHTNPPECDDGDACNGVEGCDPDTGCTTGTPLVCNDGLPCNGVETCDAAIGCVVGTPPAGCCTTNADCDDGNPCNGALACANATCKVTAEPLTCNDGNACNGTETCDPTKGCTTSNAPTCNDGNACTADSCDPQSGCLNKATDGGVCIDGNACTAGDVCKQGFCKPGAQLDCNDNNPCTADTCDSTKGCVNTAQSTACSDGNKCTVGDACKEGSCASGKPLDCNDTNACTTDACDPAKGCKNVPDVVCDDGIACTKDTCSPSGGCGHQKDVSVCNDGNACTTDSCDLIKDCVNTPLVGNPCNDGDACTEGDACSGNGICTGGMPVTCNDSNVCTTDVCDSIKGCSYTNNTSTCDDADACTEKDACKGGLCSGIAKVCNDGVVCTTDSCEAASGCKYAPNNAKCDDGNACTVDKCTSQGCSNTQQLFACNDNDPCTEDSCNPTNGACEHFNPCDDGDECTQDVCGADGSCVFKPKGCDDGNPCTVDACENGGCKNTPTSGTACNDGDACTTGDVCKIGECEGTTTDLDADGDPDGETCDNVYDVWCGKEFLPAGHANTNGCAIGCRDASGSLRYFGGPVHPFGSAAWWLCFTDKDGDGFTPNTGKGPEGQDYTGGDCDNDAGWITFQCHPDPKNPLKGSAASFQSTLPGWMSIAEHPAAEFPQ